MIYVNDQPISMIPKAMATTHSLGLNLPAEQPQEYPPANSYASIRDALLRLGIKATYRAIQSDNFVTGSAGWKLTAEGNLEANAGTFRGKLIAGSIHIPDQTTANSFHTETDGDSYWGCNVADWASDNNNANAYILKTGVARFRSINMGGSVVISGLQAGTAIDGQYLDNLSVATGALANLAITAGKIANATITATQIAGLTITASEIANATITGTQVASGTITSDNITNATITGTDIAAATITGSNIGTTTITAGNITNATITGTQIAATTIQAGNIANATITTSQISGSAGITGGQIANATITTSQISATAGIIGGQIDSLTITAGNIANLTITSSQIANTTITGAKIASDTITGSKLKIGNQSWSHDLAFSSTDLNTVTWASGTITMADAATYSITGANTGDMAARTYIYLDIAVSTTLLQTTTTAGTAVGDGKILIAVAENSTTEASFQIYGGIGGVAITGGDIENSSILAAQIATGTITANEIGANVITASEIFAGTITTTEIASDTITAGNIAAATITGTEIAATTIAAGNIVANTITSSELTTGAFVTATANITDAIITNAKINDLAVSKLTAGSITSKAITLAVSAGQGDAKIQAGKTDFGDTTSGFILGIDDSDSDKAKFEIGNSTKYLNWDGSALTLAGSYNILNGNLLLGNDSGQAITTGTNNAYLGYRAGYSNTAGYDNVFIGNLAGYNTTSNSPGEGEDACKNIFIGYKTGYDNSTGQYNIFMGVSAGENNTTGQHNIFMGNRAGITATEGNDNLAIGSGAGYFITTGSNNILLGKETDLLDGGTWNYSIGIGYDVHIIASNQCVIGGQAAGNGITDMYVGNGVYRNNPSGITINASGGQGTNNAGASLTIAGGKGCGNSAGGSINFQTSVAGASGSTLQSLSTALTIDDKRNVALGTAAIATNATDGFLYIPTCTGAPTGVPTTKTGRVAIVFDTTNNKIMVYDGAWIGIALT